MDSKSAEVHSSARGVIVSVGARETLTDTEGNAGCTVVHLSVDSWSVDAVAAPASRAFGDYVKKVERSGRAEALAAARKRLAASVGVQNEKKTLRELRLSAGMSQAELAAAASTSQPRIARLEKGQEDPSLNTLRRLASALKVDMNTINDAF